MPDISPRKLETYIRAVAALKNRSCMFAGEPIPLWIYSVNYHYGVRYIGQLTDTEFADSKDILQKMAEIHNPSALIASAFSQWDKVEYAERTPMDESLLQAALVHLVGSTRTWKELPAPGNPQDIHFVLFDWETVSRGLYLKPLALSLAAPGIINGDTLLQMVEQLGIEQATSNPQNAPLPRH